MLWSHSVRLGCNRHAQCTVSSVYGVRRPPASRAASHGTGVGTPSGASPGQIASAELFIPDLLSYSLSTYSTWNASN